MSLEQYANNFATNLAAPMLIGATTLTAGVAAPTALQGGQFRIVIDSELLLVTAGASTTTWTVTRGVEGTSAAAHAAGATIAHVLTAASLLTMSTFDVRAYGAALDGTTDDSGAMLAAVAAWYAAGGGEILIPGRMRVDSQIVIPNDGATYPAQPPLKLSGMGTHFSGRGTPIITGAPFLDLRYSGSNGKIVSTGLGLIEIEGITFKDAAATTTPFLYGTNTTWHVHNNAFIGSKVGLLCDQDAMVFGGTTNVVGNAINDAFQGYGTVIRENYFGGIRRAVLGQVYFNGNVIRDNTIWATCGSNLGGGAAIELAGYSGDPSAGNVINGNLIEVTHYPYAIKCANTVQNTIAFNDAWDPTGGVSLAVVRFESTATSNKVLDGYQPGSLAPVSPAVTGGQLNWHLAFDSGVVGEWPPANFSSGLTAYNFTGGNATTALGIASLMANTLNGPAIVLNVENGSGGTATAAYATGHTAAPALVVSYNLYSPGVNTLGTVGFQGTAPIAKPTVSGSRGSNVALASLLTALANYGLITDSSS